MTNDEEQLAYLVLDKNINVNKEEIPDEENAFLTEAKNNFFNATKNNANAINAEGYFANATSDKKNKPSITPFWRFSVVEKTGGNTFIEIPIIAQKKQIALYNYLKEPVSEIINLSRLNNSFQRLLTYKTAKGKFHELILTYVPTYSYLTSHRLDVSKIKINNIKEKKFTGYVEYRTISGVKLFTLIFKNGKSIKKLFDHKSNSNNLKVSSGDLKTTQTICDEICTPLLSRICWETGDPAVEECGEWEQYGESCVYDCFDVPDEPEDPCSLPENFYLCNPDNPSDPATGEPSFTFNPNDVVNIGDKPLQEYSDKCAGIQSIWNNYTNNEVFGYISSDGKLIVTNIQPYNGGQGSGLYFYNNIYYYPYPDTQGAPSQSYSGMIQAAGYYFIPVSASVHTHTPCRGDGTNGMTSVGSDDAQFAADHPGLNNWVIGCGAIGQFDGANSNFFNINTNTLSNNCNLIR